MQNNSFPKLFSMNFHFNIWGNFGRGSAAVRQRDNLGVTGGQIPRHVLMFTDAAALFLLSSVLCFMIFSLLFKRILLTLQPSREMM